MILSSPEVYLFKPGDFVKCVYPGNQHHSGLVAGRIYIITEILNGTFIDDFNHGTQQVQVACVTTLRSVGYGYFATRFERV